MTYMIPIYGFRKGFFGAQEEEIILPFDPAMKVRRTRKRAGKFGGLIKKIRKAVRR